MAKNKSTVEKPVQPVKFEKKARKKSTSTLKKEAPLPPKKILVESLLPELAAESRQILESFESIVQGVRPLSSRQLLRLPENIRDLSHLLTDQRGGRRMGYLNDTVYLSAYMRYFQWWNLLRLTRLFAGLKPSQLNVPDNGVCLDIGCCHS